MIYLASAYSYDRQQGYEEALAISAQILKLGIPIFSPIAHSHPMSETYDFPTDWAFWRDVDFQYIDACKEVWVYMDAEGKWHTSVGVQAETVYAISKGYAVVYISGVIDAAKAWKEKNSA